MKAATVSELKKELSTRSPKELLELCLRLSKFKKENKELLTYLLFEANDEAGYIESVKREMDQEFELINKKSFYYIKKSIRKILRNVKKYIRYSKNKETEVDLLIYFCTKLKNFHPSINRSIALRNLYYRQIQMIKKSVSSLDEDLQYDYGIELDALI
jgi:hypothetical protein